MTQQKAVAGSPVVFTTTVSNAGPDVASNLALTSTLTNGYTAQSITCVASGGATCPSTGATMAVPSLPVGAALVFTTTVAVAANAPGQVGHSMNVQVDADPILTNNTASAAVVAADQRNDTYQVFSSLAKQYALTLDFNANTYRMTGNGLDQSGSFVADAGGATYTIAGNAKFRAAQDLVVGNFDFGSGPKVFIAARKFVTDLSELSGELSRMGINLTAGVADDSRILSSRYLNGTFQSCNDNTIYSMTLCPTSSLRTYAMSIVGSDITAVDNVHNDSFTFRVAKAGSTQIMIRSSVEVSGEGVRIALPVTQGLSNGSYHSASNRGDWGTAVVTKDQSSTTYVMTGNSTTGASSTYTAPLQPSGSATGIMAGFRNIDGALTFTMQGGPVVVVVGARSGPLAGYLAIGLQ